MKDSEFAAGNFAECLRPEASQDYSRPGPEFEEHSVPREQLGWSAPEPLEPALVRQSTPSIAS